MCIEKTVSSGDCSFRNNLEKFDDNPPFRYFKNFENSRILKKSESNQQVHYFLT